MDAQIRRGSGFLGGERHKCRGAIPASLEKLFQSGQGIKLTYWVGGRFGVREESCDLGGEPSWG